MNNNLNRDFDQLFRSAEDRVIFDVKPDSWQAMELLLDRNDQQKAMVRFLLWSVLVVTLAFLIFTISKSAITGSSELDSTILSSASQFPSSNAGLIGSGNDIQGKNDSTQTNSALMEAPESIPKNSSNFDPLAYQPPQRHKVQNSANLPNHPQLSVVSVSSKNIANRLTPEDDFQALRTLDSMTIDYAPPAGLSPLTNWSISLAAGVDAVTTDWLNQNRIGYKAGVMLERKISQTFSVQSGLYVSRKNYSSSVSDYTVPEGFWTGGIKPNVILGRCQMLEIPVIGRYGSDLPNGRRFYMGAGLSSYLMLSEEYEYGYTINDPSLRQGWSRTKNAPDYWFQIGQLQLGYGITLRNTKQLDFVLNSSIPLTTLGHGKLSILSTGIEVRYTL